MAADNQIFFYDGEPLTDINPLFIGEENCEPSHSFGPRICPYTLIHYVTSGSGTLECSGKMYTASAGQIFIIYANEIASYKAAEDSPWNYIWIAFDGLYADRLKELGTSVINAPKEIFDTIHNMIYNKISDKNLAASLIYSLYSSLLPVSSERKAMSYPSEVKKMIKLRYMDDISVADIARSLNIDKRYMSRIFKEKYGTTVIGYLVEVRIKKSCELLKQNYSVADTATIVGYTDSFNFSKMFKRVMGMSPLQYKRTNSIE